MLIPKIRVQFAERLRQERKKAGLTQEEVAELIDVSSRYYQMLESRKPTSIKIDTIAKIAQALKIAPAKLFDF